jgi:hypothetical protein
MGKAVSRGSDNVVDLFEGRRRRDERMERIIRIAPEYDGLCMLYSNDSNSKKLFCVNILCWALKINGEVDGMVPWLNRLTTAKDIKDPLSGKFEGYYDPSTQQVFFEPPRHKIIELRAAADYFTDPFNYDGSQIIQEIPDTIGTHALAIDAHAHTLTLSEVLSWRLHAGGRISAMLIAHDKVTVTPVLPGDPCLHAADELPGFRYFFQHHIANQIKSEDPEALAAIAQLMDK